MIKIIKTAESQAAVSFKSGPLSWGLEHQDKGPDCASAASEENTSFPKLAGVESSRVV